MRYHSFVFPFVLQILLIVGVANNLSSQEICDDAIDNDGDGLIDLNDEEDCMCLIEAPSGLIPNPSFEEYIQCPTDEDQLTGYAVSWIQASQATSDFVHTCQGFLGNSWANNAQAPLPFPDGQGAIGFRDGNTGNRPNFKEYVGSQLNAPMEVGATYRLDFFVGFHDHPSSRTFPMAIFASDNSALLPFGGNNSTFGCPTNGPGYDELGEIVVEGINEWVNVVFEFTPDKPYQVIVLGPGCDINPNWAQEPYFFMDRLVLAKQEEFSVPAAIEGDICDDQLTLELAPDQLGYQWYHEGIALIGETEPVLNLTGSSPEGEYVAVIENEAGCLYSSTYDLAFPLLVNQDTVTICEGESIEFGGNLYGSAGTYEDIFTVGLLCDSLSVLELRVNPNTSGEQYKTFCTGETVEHEGQSFTTGGEYELILKNQYGCDSSLTLILNEVDTAVLYMDPVIEICAGEFLLIGAQEVNTPGVYQDTFALDTGCDSISVFELIVNKDSEGSVSEILCPEETITIGSQIYKEAGQYLQTLENTSGCDSLLNVEIINVDHIETLVIADTISAKLGEYIDFIPDASLDAVEFEWFVRGDLISEEKDLIQIQPYNSETYILKAYTEFGCLTERSIVVELDKEIKVFTPNVLVKNQPNNNRFFLGTNLATDEIKQLSIYDRWGEEVYAYSGSIDNQPGWDGRFRSGYVEQGVYTYVAELAIVDGSTEWVVGNVTFLY